jgi:PAS domain S-box-containing protein
MTKEASLNPLAELNNPTEISKGFGLLICAGFCWAAFIFVLGQIFHWGDLKEISLVSDAMQAAVAAVAVLMAWRVTKHPAIDAAARRFWKILTFAYFSYACGHSLWFYYSSVLEIEPFPSWADAGFLGFYPLMLWALLSFPKDQSRHSDRRTLILDIAIVMLAGTMTVWHFIVQPTLATVTDADWLTPVLNISYTVGDMVLMLGITTILLRRVNAVSRRTLGIIVFGLINISIADFGFAYLTLQGTYFSGHWVDNFFISGMLFTMIASHFQYQQLNKQTVREVEKDQSETAHSFGWLPYSAVLIGCGLLLFESRSYWSEPLGYLIFASLGITALVVFRQTAAVKENVRLLAEQTARQSETHFRTLVEHSSDLIAILDVRGHFIYQSPSFKTVLGYETDALIGRHSLEFVTPEDAENIKNDYRITLGDATAILKREYAFKHADGSWRVLESITKTINDEENKFSGILFNLRDVTERRAAENKLRAFTSKLETSNRELQDFAFVASHDLQEPLRKVQAFGDRLKSKYGEILPENGLDYLDRMQSAARRMQTLITDLLTFSRVTTKAKPFTSVDLDKITHDVLSDLEVKIGETGAVISVGELPVIDADATQMRQLMQNLIGNALKFRRPDTVPEIKVYQSETNGDLPRDFCRITVEDNGIGFDEKYLDRIFTVFQRLHGRGEYEGSGVGLAVCRKIVERHGGTLTAHSEPEQGAKFIISLPKIQENTGETDETGFPNIHDSISR